MKQTELKKELKALYKRYNSFRGQRNKLYQQFIELKRPIKIEEQHKVITDKISNHLLICMVELHKLEEHNVPLFLAIEPETFEEHLDIVKKSLKSLGILLVDLELLINEQK
jgi:uncharacterized coiled-coil DUF342 family protein